MTKSTMRLSVLTLAGAGLAAVLAPTSAAAEPTGGSSVNACTNTHDARTDQLSANGEYWYDGQATTTQTCGTISIRVLDGSNSQCSFFRLRIFPSSGGSYTEPGGAWVHACIGDAKTLATNYKIGTKYRVESTGPGMNVRARD